MQLQLNKPTRFKGSDITVLRLKDQTDQQGTLFYKTLKEANVFFNLPPGFYEINGLFEELKPYRYYYFNLPQPEKNVKLKPLIIRLTKNLNKASIDINTGVIIFDRDYFNRNPTYSLFILFHEIAHNYYFNEYYSDLFALNCMLKEGFNFSQVYISVLNTLSNEARKRFLKNVLNDYKKYSVVKTDHQPQDHKEKKF